MISAADPVKNTSSAQQAESSIRNNSSRTVKPSFTHKLFDNEPTRNPLEDARVRRRRDDHTVFHDEDVVARALAHDSPSVFSMITSNMPLSNASVFARMLFR